MHFIHLDCAGNRVTPPTATRKEDRQRDERAGTEIRVGHRLHGGNRRNETGFPGLSQAIAPGTRPVYFCAMQSAGYSGTPLPQKLGIKAGQKICTIGAPVDYRKLLAPLPEKVSFAKEIEASATFIHAFISERKALERELKRLRKLLADAGVLWISWPKKSSGVATDVTEDVIREVALPLGFVDVKVCAVDETWSGLKLMVRRENRKAKK